MTYDLNTLSAARLWPYHPDWSQGYEVRRAFLTDIARSRSNMEQRRALRDVPRFSAYYSAVVSGDDQREARQWLNTRQNMPAAVPDFSRHALTTGSASIGGTAITIASPPAWIAANRLIVLCSDVAMELVQVDEVSGSTVNLIGALDNNWPSGSVVRPVIHGLLSGDVRASRYRRGASAITVDVLAYPGGEPPEDEGAASDTFNGYEVFTAEPNWSGAPVLDYLWPVEEVDFGIGRTAQFRPIARPQQLDDAEFAGLSPSAVQAIEQFFLRHKGRRNAFYRPTTEKDFTLAATASTGSGFFLHPGTSLADDMGAINFTTYPAAIEVVMVNGTRIRRLVTGITSSGGNSRVDVNANWPTNLTASNVARISWMPLVRFGSDELVTRWQTPIAATIRAAFQGVRE